jgi:hypothetical protein
MSSQVTKVVLNIAVTGLLAVGFFALFVNVPFLSQFTGEKPESPQTVLKPPMFVLPGAEIFSGVLPPSTLPGLQAPGTTGLFPSAGLFSARFAAIDGNPAYATVEVAVDGACLDAGRRHIEQVCPDCQVLEGKSRQGLPQMLLWTEPGEKENKIHSVTTDCTEVANDGRAIVGTVSFDGDENGNSTDIVPLLAGGTRLAAMEMGGWLTTMDLVEQPEKALLNMSAALQERGWREAAGQESGIGVPLSDQRVFTKNGRATCVVYISRDGGTAQLITVVST